MHKIINFCARVVTGRRRSDHVSDAIKLLGWLGAGQLIEFHTVCAERRVILHEEPAHLYRTIGPRAADIHQRPVSAAPETGRCRESVPSLAGAGCATAYRGIRLLNERRLDPAAAAGFRSTLMDAIRADE